MSYGAHGCIHQMQSIFAGDGSIIIPCAEPIITAYPFSATTTT